MSSVALLPTVMFVRPVAPISPALKPTPDVDTPLKRAWLVPARFTVAPELTCAPVPVADVPAASSVALPLSEVVPQKPTPVLPCDWPVNFTAPASAMVSVPLPPLITPTPLVEVPLALSLAVLSTTRLASKSTAWLPAVPVKLATASLVKLIVPLFCWKPTPVFEVALTLSVPAIWARLLTITPAPVLAAPAIVPPPMLDCVPSSATALLPPSRPLPAVVLAETLS
ncbi:hypothetical protein LMG28727_07689 [Paraburkholderia kirstenboschensis]|nr:hypothetical protein LMG28727_07689 [Paraburkholderia kirstenboschensis]